MKKLTITIAFFAFITSVVVYAYTAPPASDTLVNQPPTERTWQYVDKSTAAIGSFLLAKEGKIFIEQTDNIISIPIEELSWVDQRFVSQSLKEMEAQDSRLVLPRPKYAQLHWGANHLIALSLLFMILGVGTFSEYRFTYQNA